MWRKFYSQNFVELFTFLVFSMAIALTTDKCHIKHGHSHGGGGGHGHSHGSNAGQTNSHVHSESSDDYVTDENENDLNPRNRRISLSRYTPDEAVGV